MASMDELASSLREARKIKGISQRELGARVGTPQSHISKIEAGDVDIQLSSLTEIARALDLEVELVPRRALPAVQGAIKVLTTGVANGELQNILRKLTEAERLLARLTKEYPDLPGLDDFDRTLRDAKAVKPSLLVNKDIHVALDPITRLALILDANGSPDILAKAVQVAVTRLRRFRDRHTHAAAPNSELQRPAYRLEDDD